MKDATEGYRTFLGLASHEYFHSWNVKRIKPAAFAPYDLTQENTTRLLWAFEGFTSYYDDLLLRRSELLTEALVAYETGRRGQPESRMPGSTGRSAAAGRYASTSDTRRPGMIARHRGPGFDSTAVDPLF